MVIERYVGQLQIYIRKPLAAMLHFSWKPAGYAIQPQRIAKSVNYQLPYYNKVIGKMVIKLQTLRFKFDMCLFASPLMPARLINRIH